jgi:indoleamine 2,3-dioxygenase
MNRPGVGQGVERAGLQPVHATFRQRGFLPVVDPVTGFPADSRLAMLDELGRDLPSLLMDSGFRCYARGLHLPPWPDTWAGYGFLPLLRLYYLRVGFLASAYINQVGEPEERVLPANIARPLVDVCGRLGRPPILSYDGYALYNWKRFNPEEPVVLGNIDTLQNFVHLYDEHWFILVHVEIEARAAEVLDAIAEVSEATPGQLEETLNHSLYRIAASVNQQAEVLRRIPEKMDPSLYYRTFRPYIRFFENVRYEGVELPAMQFRGETGAQSSIMPLLEAFLKIPHKPSVLTNHLLDMRNYMPQLHRELLGQVEAMASVKPQAAAEAFNSVLEAIAGFREIHLGWAEEYINRRTDDPRGTGGTPYMQWLKQLIDETRSHML